MSEKPPLVDAPAPDVATGTQEKTPIYRRLVDWLFAPWMKDESARDYDWRLDAHRAYIEQQPLRARALLYVVAVTVICLIIWSALATIA